MSDDENTGATGASERPGLTKPLVNNVGGVIDQDAPSADQLLQGRPDPTWSDTPLEESPEGVRDEDRSGLFPGLDRASGVPGSD